MQTGATHEGMNIAAVEKVPLVLVATNNHFAYSTPNDREFACADLVDRAKGYGYEGHTVDGTDLDACLEVIGTAVKRARAGRPPQLVVARLFASPATANTTTPAMSPPKLSVEPFAQDCLQRTETVHSRARIGSTPKRLQQMARRDCGAKWKKPSRQRNAKPHPSASEEDWCAISTRELVDRIP